MSMVDSMLNSLFRQSCEIQATIKKLKQTDYKYDEKNFNYLSRRLDILGEKYAYCIRQFCEKTFALKRCEIYDNASEVLGIEAHREGNQIVIDLPFLLPWKKQNVAKFIGEPLRYQLEQLRGNGSLKFKEKVVICIVHMYDSENKKGRCYDYDNLECKRILDVITSFTMPDDSPKYCDVFQTSEFGDSDKTRIFVMPASEFFTPKNPCFPA